MSLEDRTADFSRAFPNKKISHETLRRIYIKNQVRKKKVRVTNIPNRKESKRIKKTIQEAKQQLEDYRQRGFRIIFIDETMITKSTIASHEWSKKYTNYQMDMK